MEDSIDQIIYTQMHAYKYMLENRYSFDEYVNTVVVQTAREIKGRLNKDKDEKSE